LLVHDFVDGGALEDAVGSVGEKLVDEHVGDALADVLIGAEDGLDAGHDGAVAEVEDRDATFFLSRSGQ